MNSETLGLALFTTTTMGIFSTQFKCFETENTANSSLKTSPTIYMALNQRITQVGKDPYLLELSELHQIGVHPWPSPRRSTLLLAPSRTDGPNGRKSREKAHLHSPKFGISHPLSICSSNGEKSYSLFCLILIKHSKNSHHVPKFWILTLGTI